MDCRDAGERLYEYLDRELSVEEACEVSAHLARCPGCWELVRFEGGVIKLVRLECGSESAPQRLRDRVSLIPTAGR